MDYRDYRDNGKENGNDCNGVMYGLGSWVRGLSITRTPTSHMVNPNYYPHSRPNVYA